MANKRLLKTSAILFFAILISLCFAGCASVTTEPQYDAEGNLLEPESYGKVSLGNYKNLKAKETILEVTDEDVQIEIDYFLNNTEKYSDASDRNVEEGDVVAFEFSGTIDGIPFDGGTGEDEIKVGSGDLWPGFEQAMVGMKKGETKDIKVVFPKDYPESAYAGREAVFTTTVNEIKTENNTEFNDEWVVAQTDGECKTTEEFRERCRKDLERAMADNAKANVQGELLKQVVDSSTFHLNKTAVEYQYQLQRKEFENFIRSYGMDVDAYLEAFDSDNEKFETDFRAISEETVKEVLVKGAIAAKEGITPDDVAEFLYNNATIER